MQVGKGACKGQLKMQAATLCATEATYGPSLSLNNPLPRCLHSTTPPKEAGLRPLSALKMHTYEQDDM